MLVLFNRQSSIFHLQQSQVVVLSLVLAGIVFLADLFTPLGVASGVPYSLAVLLALNAPSRRSVVAFAILCSILTVSDFYIGPGRGGSELWKVVTNRFLAVSMIWITLTLGMLRKVADDRRQQAENQTRLHLADLAHMNRVSATGHLAATLAHELNQPLAAISIHSEIAIQLMRQNGNANPQLLQALSEITEQSHRAADIMRGVRSLVRKSEPQQSLVQLNDAVRDVTKLLDAQLKQSEVSLELRLTNIPPVKGDAIQLKQVLLNLLQNAVDAVDDADKLPRRVLVDTHVNGRDRIVCRVTDTGTGLDAGRVEQVFERFYSTKPKGMGMGLAISRSIIEAHGGRLWAEPNPDRGATFSFSLPNAT